MAPKPSFVLCRETSRAKDVNRHGVDKAPYRKYLGLGECLQQASQPLAARLANTVLATLYLYLH